MACHEFLNEISKAFSEIYKRHFREVPQFGVRFSITMSSPEESSPAITSYGHGGSPVASPTDWSLMFYPKPPSGGGASPSPTFTCPHCGNPIKYGK